MTETKVDLIGFIANAIVKVFGLKKETPIIDETELIDFIVKTTKCNKTDVVKILDAEYLFMKIKGVSK